MNKKVGRSWETVEAAAIAHLALSAFFSTLQNTGNFKMRGPLRRTAVSSVAVPWTQPFVIRSHRPCSHLHFPLAGTASLY